MVKVDKLRAIYPRGQVPDPALLRPEFVQPGRKWVPQSGPYKGQIGSEHCATREISWVGLMFPGEDMYHALPIEELKPVD